MVLAKGASTRGLRDDFLSFFSFASIGGSPRTSEGSRSRPPVRALMELQVGEIRPCTMKDDGDVGAHVCAESGEQDLCVHGRGEGQ